MDVAYICHCRRTQQCGYLPYDGARSFYIACMATVTVQQRRQLAENKLYSFSVNVHRVCKRKQKRLHKKAVKINMINRKKQLHLCAHCKKKKKILFQDEYKVESVRCHLKNTVDGKIECLLQFQIMLQVHIWLCNAFRIFNYYGGTHL